MSVSLRTNIGGGAPGMDEQPGRNDDEQLHVAEKQQQKPLLLLNALCKFNRCSPFHLAMTMRRRKQENLQYLTKLTIETMHLRQNLQFTPDNFTRFGARHMYAYRGFLGLTVEQYLYVKHRIKMKYPLLPCIMLFGGKGHQSYFPIELLKISSE